MHHLVALGGSVLQGLLNLRDHGATAEYNGRFRRSAVDFNAYIMTIPVAWHM